MEDERSRGATAAPPSHLGSSRSLFVCLFLLFFNLMCIYGPLINSDEGNKYTVGTGKVKGLVLGFEVSVLAPSKLL